MPSISSWLSDVSRRKLRSAASSPDGLRDTLNLRRFVLLKNSITQAESQPLALASSTQTPLLSHGANAPLFSNPHASASHDSEEKWLESVLETLENDFDAQVEVQVRPVADTDELDSLTPASSTDSFASWVPSHDGFAIDNNSLPISTDNFLSSPSPMRPPQFQAPASLQLLFPTSHFPQSFVEPRYPEADFDLPTSDTSSDSESEDDDGPLTPYGGSEPSLGERASVEPEVYVEHDSYFLYPSELDLMSTPIYYQQC